MPERLHPVVHPDGGGLVDADHHRLAELPAPQEVLHQVLGNLVEPVTTGDQLVLAAELTLDQALDLLVDALAVEQVFHVGLQLGVGQLQLRDAVLVVERHGGPVLHRFSEVVDRDVIAEDLAGLLLAVHQRRAGEPDERGVRQGGAHVAGEEVVLAAVGLVGHHDHVAAARELRVDLARRRVELLNQREQVAVVLTEQLPQVRAAAGPHGLLRFLHGAGAREGGVDLLVELVAVGDDQETPVARHLAQHLAREEHHAQTLARALGVPEHAEAAPVLLHAFQRAAAHC